MNKLVKILLITIVLLLPLPAYGQWEEMIYTGVPYSVNRVEYHTQVQPTQPTQPTTKVNTTDYLVQPGDTLWLLASQHGITVDKLAALNGLSSESPLIAGQRLKLPGNTVNHTVKAGETLINICRQYQVTMGMLLKANNISNPDLVVAGQVLSIPVATEVATITTPTTTTSEKCQLPVPTMAWPVAGEVSSHFGIREEGRPHQGVDIAANQGATIKAPLGGYVAYAGYYGTYGNTVIIDHGEDIRSLYAHCATLLVKEGQSISQGQAIARVGNTGRSFGPHLHWEVYYQGIPFDPLLCMISK